MPSVFGKPACDCLVQWLPAYEAELKARGIVVNGIDVLQLIGNAPASAGVHSTGGAFDIKQTQDEAVWVARQMGADATWARVGGVWTGNEHSHGVLRGCPHNLPARYQIAAVDAGFNGLGTNGRGGPDNGPRPLSGRTWQAGLVWQRERAQRRAERLRLTDLIASLRAKRVAIKDRIGALIDKRKAL